MKRLTTKAVFNYITPDNVENIDQKCLNKLGELEDLMDKFELENVKELEKILNDFEESCMLTIAIYAFVKAANIEETFFKLVKDFNKEYEKKELEGKDA